MVKAVVFDVGETLVNETRLWCRWADRLGVPRFTLLGVLGGIAALDRPLFDAFAIVRPGVDVEAELVAWKTDDPTGLRAGFDIDDLYPDVRPTLLALHQAGIRVIIAGNQPTEAKSALLAMDLAVDDVFISAEWEVEKPDPMFFTKLSQAAGVAPEETVYIGDRLDNDVLPAKKAGMHTVLLRRGPWGYLHAIRPEATEADTIIDSLSQLPPLVEKWREAKKL